MSRPVRVSVASSGKLRADNPLFSAVYLCRRLSAKLTWRSYTSFETRVSLARHNGGSVESAAYFTLPDLVRDFAHAFPWAIEFSVFKSLQAIIIERLVQELLRCCTILLLNCILGSRPFGGNVWSGWDFSTNMHRGEGYWCIFHICSSLNCVFWTVRLDDWTSTNSNIISDLSWRILYPWDTEGLSRPSRTWRGAMHLQCAVWPTNQQTVPLSGRSE